MATASVLLTPDDVAERLGVPKATLYTWRHRGDGPAWFRVGRHLRTTEADLAAWLDLQREREATGRAR